MLMCVQSASNVVYLVYQLWATGMCDMQYSTMGSTGFNGPWSVPPLCAILPGRRRRLAVPTGARLTAATMVLRVGASTGATAYARTTTDQRFCHYGPILDCYLHAVGHHTAMESTAYHATAFPCATTGPLPAHATTLRGAPRVRATGLL